MYNCVKKILSLFLVVVMLISVAPVSVSQAEADANETIAEPQSTLSYTSSEQTSDAFTESGDIMEESSGAVSLTTADCKILRHVNKEVFIKNDHVARLPQEEDLSSYVFQNRDGSRTLYIMDEPVKFVNAEGSIVEKDLTLSATNNGYKTAQNDVSLNIPNDPASGINLGWSGKNITLIPQDGTIKGVSQITDNTITYPDYFGEGMSLKYTPTLSGVKEDIVLSAYSGINSFKFTLNTAGLNLYQDEGRFYLADNKLSKDRIELGDIVSFDAHGRFSIGTMTADTIVAGQSYQLTITVDEAFLTSETTTYPVSIDPTLTVNYDTYGDNAVEDVSVYSGKPTTNGNWTYLHCGYYDDTYKVARTLFRLPGLTRSSVYSSPNSFTITSAEFHIREATGTAGISVKLNANNGSATWTESGATWNNSGMVIGTQYATASAAYEQECTYNITNLVKAWQKGTLDPAAGFILQSSNETSVDKAFYSAEYSTSSSRPYVVVNYTYNTTGLNYTTLDIDEGNTSTLTLSGASGTVTWTSSNPDVATVSSSGVVTGVKAGVARISASAPDYTTQSCTVYVTIADGVYRIGNAGLYLGTTSDNSPVKLLAGTFSMDTNLMRQLWKVTYLDDGYYSIRPMHHLSMGLSVEAALGCVKNIGTEDSTTAVSLADRWTIAYYSGGYALRSQGSYGMSLRAPSVSPTSGSTVSTDSFYGSSVFYWFFTLVPGVFLINASSNIPYTFIPNKYIELENSSTLSNLSFYTLVSGAANNSQAVSWSVSKPDIVTVATSGTVTTNKRGKTTVTAYQVINNSVYQAEYYLTVRETIYVKNFYDGTLENDTDILNYIDDAVSFLNNIYNTDFYLWFEMDGVPQRYPNAATDICPHGSNASCVTLLDCCDENCSNHHKNLARIAEEAQNAYFEKNHLVVLWSNCPEGVYCINGPSGHETTPALAAVTGASVDGVMQSRPVIQMLTINQYSNPDNYTFSDVAFMSLVLAHEVGHTLGLREVYDNHYGDNPNHEDYTTYKKGTDTNFQMMNCIMNRLLFQSAQDYYSGYLYEPALCEYCVSKLMEVMPTNVYEN